MSTTSTNLFKWVHHLLFIPALFMLASILWYLTLYPGSFKRLWISADQQAYRLYQQEHFLQAAQTFTDAAYKGSAYYRAGEFKKAAAVYQTLSDANARYNLGNAHLMMGKYQEAIDDYALALKIQPDFTHATDNKALAESILAQLNALKNNDEGTGGQLAADEILYDNQAGHGEEIQEQNSTAENNVSHWLDRLQTGPREFLKHKFAYQYAHQHSHTEAD